MIGKFIVIEGLEGAGKSSAIAACMSVLAQNSIDVINTREPGGTPMAEAIRDCVKHDWDEKVSPETELMLMYAARKQLIDNVISPALSRGQWVLSDRHDHSTLAYQGGGREIPDSVIQPIREVALSGLTPDLILYLDVDPATGLERARGRGELDRIEKAGLAFFERTRERYLTLAEANDKMLVIDAMQEMEKVQQEIVEHITQLVSAC